MRYFLTGNLLRARMRSTFMLCAFLLFCKNVSAQKHLSSSELLNEMQKLGTFNTVLYIAAHPDDENTRLLSYLVNEKKYRTGYLSLTRGDGGQNLIGNEQGIFMGMIRTQELIAARKVDGAEQFFTRAYDFGYSKSPEEALSIWGHEAVLSDVVWAIRTFRPDVIICRFPSTGEGGHGHHTASAILAAEAFDAAADPKKFPEQLQKGVTVWQASKLLWNTFSFGNTNTIKENQFRINCGGYNPLLGVSYGELSAISRSRHSSQGFGVAAQRGDAFEYFETIKGKAPVNDLMNDVETGVEKLRFEKKDDAIEYERLYQTLISSYNPLAPHLSVRNLQSMERLLQKAGNKELAGKTLKVLRKCILAVSGIHLEATTTRQQWVQGDTVKIHYNIICRSAISVRDVRMRFLSWETGGTVDVLTDSLRNNIADVIEKKLYVSKDAPLTQPYWLSTLPNGIFNVENQVFRNLPEIEYPQVSFTFNINDIMYEYIVPVQYKYTNPTKGEVYQPVIVTAPVLIELSPSRFLISSQSLHQQVRAEIAFRKTYKGRMQLYARAGKSTVQILDTVIHKSNGEIWEYTFSLPEKLKQQGALYVHVVLENERNGQLTSTYANSMYNIQYEHIPDLTYHAQDSVQLITMDLKKHGKRIGYIAGAGDKIPEALEDMGYEVIHLDKQQILDLQKIQPDAIITGVRAYNVHAWLDEVYPQLMTYVENGGILLVQYNTNNRLAPVKSRISPYPFTITRNRVTEENAEVQWDKPLHKVLTYPNEITAKDFEGWVQERSVYHAGSFDKAFVDILKMHDKGEPEQAGALIVAEYGKGRFIYTGLSFFRQLPAGVPGAYRLLANLISK